MANVVLNLNGISLNLDIPTEKVADVKQADEMLVMAEYLTAIVKKVKDNCSEAVIANGGSDNFSAVGETVVRTVDWNALAEELEIPQEVIGKFTKTSNKKAFVKKKANLVPSL